MSSDEVVNVSDSDDSVIITEIPPDIKIDAVWSMSSPEQSSECIILDDDDEDDNAKNNNEKTKKPIDLLQPLFAINEPHDDGEDKINKESIIKEYPCSMCHKIFYDKNVIASHELEHYKIKTKKRLKLLEAKFKCCVCSMEFENKNDYEWHSAECSGKYLAHENLNIRLTRNKK